MTSGCWRAFHAIHRKSKGCYESPPIHAELRDEHQIRVGCKRVARLVRESGLEGVTPTAFVRTTQSDGAEVRGDRVERRFRDSAPDQLGVADITCIPTWAGSIYLAIVLDVFSRKIVGWAIENHLRTELLLQATSAAIEQRRPTLVVHNSDHGCQFTSYAFGERC